LPAAQVGCEWATVVGQVVPHPPQFARSVCVSTQTPPLHSVCPAAHPVEHVGGPPSPDGKHTGPPESAAQVTPQAPQFAAVFSWTQTLLQSV
jgi:hypothetical protein